MHLFQSLLFLTRYALILAFGCLLMVPLLHPVSLWAQESGNPPTKSSGQLVDASKLPRPGSAPAGLDNQAPPTDPNTVIAKFDSSSITLGEVDQQLKMRPGAQEFFQNAPPELVRKVRLGALNSLVDRELLFKEAKKNGVAIDDKVLVENVNQVLQQFGPDETQRNERMSAFGLTQEELKKQIGIDLTIKGYIEKFVGKDTAITEQEVKATFDAHPSAYNTPKAVKISHILITVPQNADEASENAAKKKIDEIYKEAQGKDADFAELAKKYSQGPSAPQGGDIGYISPGQTVAPFESAAMNLKSGEMSQPVRTQFGYHVIKAFEVIPEKTATFESVKDKIKKNLEEQKQMAVIQEHLKHLHETYKVETFL